MPDANDQGLLREYARNQSEAAFAELVHRHINLVYSVAMRFTGNGTDAQDVTQAVFIILAKKAVGLREKTNLTGWLYETTRFTAMSSLRNSARRHIREQEAYMQADLNEADDNAWQQFAPHLEEAMAGLSEKDRALLALRYFNNKSGTETAALLGINEWAVHKRTSRALEKLRRSFSRRGLVFTTATIAAAISVNSVQAAPALLAKSVSAVAITKGAAVSGSTLTLIKGALKIMAWTKAKTAIVVGMGLLLAAGTVTVTIHEISKPKFDPKDFWATSYPTFSASPEAMQFLTNRLGNELDSTFPASPVQGCSIQGLLDQCMEVSGWRYFLDKEVSAGGYVQFGHQKELTGAEWVAAFENALQTAKPEWWDPKTKRFRRENLVLIHFPKEKEVLVLPKDKAAKYQ